MQVIREVAPRDFELAFAVVHTFDINPTRAYSSAAQRLAEAGDLVSLRRFLGNIQGTTTDHEYDQVGPYRGLLPLLLAALSRMPSMPFPQCARLSVCSSRSRGERQAAKQAATRWMLQMQEGRSWETKKTSILAIWSLTGCCTGGGCCGGQLQEA